MSSRVITPRVILDSAVLLLGAVLAHALACGTFISLIPLFLISFLLVVALALLSIRELKGPSLAVVVILAQLGAHFLLGGGQMRQMQMLVPLCGGSSRHMTMMMVSMMSPTLMISSHTLAAIASYLFISKSEEFWSFAGFVLFSIFIPRLLPRTSTSNLLRAQTRTEITRFISRLPDFLTEASNRLSAPPIFQAI